jgi:hypothetical protein
MRTWTRTFSALIGATALGLVACGGPSHVLVGTPRPPTTPDQVKVYTHPPAEFEQIAIVDASSQGSWTWSNQAQIDKAIERLKQEAAKLGANGLLFQGAQKIQTGSVGGGVGNSSYGPSSASGASVGGGFGITNQEAKGVAIYVTKE